MTSIREHDSDYKIVLPCVDSYEFVTLNQLVHCEAKQNYTQIFLKDTRVIICTISIGALERKLVEHGFISCHKSHLINRRHILRYKKEGYVEMTDESNIPVSRRKKAEFMKQVIDKYNISTVDILA